MTNPTNWPNPERPGVPMFPERDGWHELQGLEGGITWWWNSHTHLWMDRPCGGISRTPTQNAWITYRHPLLTPTQIAELLAGERDRCADKVVAYALRTNHGIVAQRALKDAETGIRNLGAAP